MSEDLGWSRTLIAGAASFGGLLATVASPAVGWALDRFGARVILTLSILVMGIATVSLAWATAEHLAKDICCYTLFATHYFELTQLADDLEHAVNVHLTATEHDDSIVFLHNVHDGPASQSYGLQVAKLAGPSAVTATAISADGKTAAVATADNIIRLVNLADGKVIRELKGHTAVVGGLEFFPHPTDASRLDASSRAAEAKLAGLTGSLSASLTGQGGYRSPWQRMNHSFAT